MDWLLNFAPELEEQKQLAPGLRNVLFPIRDSLYRNVL